MIGEYASDIWAILISQLGHNAIIIDLHKASAQLITVNWAAADGLLKETDNTHNEYCYAKH